MPVRLLALLLSLACTLTAQAANLAQQRLYYDQAKAALAKGDSSVYQRYAGALVDYPLEPYLAYDELTHRLKWADDREIEQFLQDHGDLPHIGWMKLRWLRWQAERERWQSFAAYYDPNLNFTELDCLYGQYLFEKKLLPEAKAQAEKLYLVGKSQPEACDALFNTWRSQGGMTEEQRWQRTKLAAEARNYGLASHLGRGLSQHSASAELLVQVAQNPLLLKQTARFSAQSRDMADLVGLGLRRLARQDPDLALNLLDYYGARLPFSADEKVAIAREVGLALAKRFDSRALKVMAQYDPQLRDNTVSEWRARLLLRLGQWNEAAQLVQKLPAPLANTPRWRYWQARSLELAQPQNPKAHLAFQQLAQERDYFGFLAADRVKASYSLNHQPLALDARVVQKVRNSSGIRRALEFQARGQIVDARREWYHASRTFNRDELVAQAKIAYDMGWYFPAIRSISQAQYWDDLEIRFPMAHKNTLVREAQNFNIHSSWIFAITRQESAFMNDARSGVGAIGLMQLMPATAQETARRNGIPLSNPKLAYQPEVNIQLGAAYLNQLLGQFNGNRVLASAAYNAGPGRVRQWLKEAKHLPFDVWVENIPFDETRQYVQNVLTYSVIYGKKLGTPQPVVDWHERFFDDQ